MLNIVTFYRINISLALMLTLLCAGCSTQYTIQTVGKDSPIPFASYRWNYVRLGRQSLDGSGTTDASGNATFKSYPGACVYVMKGNLWGKQYLHDEDSLYTVKLSPMDKHPMDLAAKIVLGFEGDEDEVPK